MGEAGLRRAILLATLLAMAACSTPTEAPPPAPPPPVAKVTPPREPDNVVADACNAAAHRHLIGRPRSEIPVPVQPNLQRVLCTTCPMTMDHNPNRLNFLFDAGSGKITEVRCG